MQNQFNIDRWHLKNFAEILENLRNNFRKIFGIIILGKFRNSFTEPSRKYCESFENNLKKFFFNSWITS